MKLCAVARSFATVVAMLGVTASASAQEEKTVGLTMTYPAAVGLQWQITDRVALRSDVTYSWSSTESSTTLGGGTEQIFSGGLTQVVFGLGPGGTASTSTYTATGIGVGLAALITVHRKDALRLYVGPSIDYFRMTTTSDNEGFFSGLPPEFSQLLNRQARSRTATESNYSVAGLFGAQYALTDRFSVLVETGVAYGWSDSGDASPISLTSRHRSIRHRSSVGGILFF